jgi:hypothetical protein
MNWNREIDLYCERTGPGLFEEPLNALSNLGFVLAAWLVWRKGRGRTWDMRVLACLIALVGVASLAFHTFAMQWAAAIDTAAIALFIWFFLQRLLVRAVGFGNISALLMVMSYAVTAYMVERYFNAEWLNGSIAYVPPLVVLGGVSVSFVATKGALGAPFFIATILFGLSLVLRTIDLAVCHVFHAGTHFLWHLLNAAVLYALGIGLAGFISRRARR